MPSQRHVVNRQHAPKHRAPNKRYQVSLLILLLYLIDLYFLNFPVFSRTFLVLLFSYNFFLPVCSPVSSPFSLLPYLPLPSCPVPLGVLGWTNRTRRLWDNCTTSWETGTMVFQHAHSTCSRLFLTKIIAYYLWPLPACVLFISICL